MFIVDGHHLALLSYSLCKYYEYCHSVPRPPCVGRLSHNSPPLSAAAQPPPTGCWMPQHPHNPTSGRVFSSIHIKLSRCSMVILYYRNNMIKKFPPLFHCHKRQVQFQCLLLLTTNYTRLNII